MDEKNDIKTRFFDMFEVKSKSAQSLYDSLKECITSKGIPFENLVGFSSDTTNAMVGEHNSVFSHLKQESPYIACIKCSCHMIHLAASKACLNLPKHVEDLLRNLGAHFNRSYGRQLAFKEFQEFFRVEIHKILSPAATRWLSLKACVDRVLEQYEPLKAYLREACFEDPSYTIQTMFDTMDNQFTKVYLEFMSYVLGILVDFNLLFQSDKPLLHQLKPQVEKMLKDICSNFIDMKYLKKTHILEVQHAEPRIQLPYNKLYLGVAASESLHDLQQNTAVEAKDIDHFFKSILKFILNLLVW
ncbi:hypothetical protein JTE90_016351 [Oedothorax gibbosus]|uniref:Uncharacterized protein n=1 Tax=Oedothorax gibbosus TaxID=931172 RepID=A0AAV6U6P6_9ARAC|nr:hypothetical protein JTE90_016351 [Oedothorax gibbosus]